MATPRDLLEAYMEVHEVPEETASQMILNETFEENLRTLLEWNGITGFTHMILQTIRFAIPGAEAFLDAEEGDPMGDHMG